MSLPLKRLATVIAGQSPVSDEVEDLADGLPFIQGNAEFGLRHPSPKWQCTTAPKVACMDDVLISVRAPVGATNIAEGPLGIGRGVAAVRATDMNPAYLYWFLTSSSDMLHAEATGSTFAAITASDLGDLEVPITDVADQRSIADYLDRETATIDALIEKQRQLIEGLRERGDASWRRLYDSVLKTVRPLPLRRHVQSISDGPFGSALTSAHYAASGVRVIRLGNIGPGVFKLDDEAFISHEYGEKLKRYAVSPGDLIMAGLGDSNVSLGRTAEVPEGLGPAINKADCFRLRLHAGVDSRYMVVALNAPQTRELVLQLAQGSTRQRMNTSVAARLPVAVPDPRCQAQVVEQWESETAKIDALIAKAERFIELAQERRAALITAAVTGQIEIPTED